MNRAIASFAFCWLLSATFLPVAEAPAANGDCGQPQSTGTKPTTSDALAALRRAVGGASPCDAKPCICDVTGEGMITTSDALRILRFAVGQSVQLECSCEEECLLLGDAAATAPATRGMDVAPRQVRIEAKIVGMNKQSFADLGLQFALSTTVTTDSGPEPGGTSGHDQNLAVDSDASGGPAGLQYFLYAEHPAQGALPVLNKNFVSPFDDVKSFFLLPGDGCVQFDEGSFVVPQNFPGGDPVENLPPADMGFGGDTIRYDIFEEAPASNLLNTIQGDNRNVVLSAPDVTVYVEQSLLHMADDVTPTLNQVATEFRARIQEVTPSPFGIFTGVTLDVRPRIDGDNIVMELRLGSKLASFFFSTAFSVGGSQVDAEIPLHHRSRNLAQISVPDGKTLVIGGLKRMGQTTVEPGLPVLGDLPLIGGLFAHEHFDQEQQNLIVFIRASIVAQN